MKTKMIRGLRVLVVNDINKTGRKFHLDYVICSAPQDQSDRTVTWRRNWRKFRCGGALVSTLNQTLMSKHVLQSEALNRYMKCRWARLSALVRGPNVKSQKRHPAESVCTSLLHLGGPPRTMSPHLIIQ